MRCAGSTIPSTTSRSSSSNDRSTDRTGELADAHAAGDPRIVVHHRHPDARPGKPAAIKEVINSLTSEIVVFFDADYLPSPTLLKSLVAPFVDPEVGATMGRVVPYNTNVNLLTKLIDLERRGGYAVDQQARSLWNLLPQFGGTVGGVRLAALRAVGGWRCRSARRRYRPDLPLVPGRLDRGVSRTRHLL